MPMTNLLKVGILRGGAYSRGENTCPEYDASLATGNLVINNLSESCKPVDLFVDRNGLWHVQGMPATESRMKENVDVVFNALHGPFALGGGVEKVLGGIGLPYTGTIFSDSAFPISRTALSHRLKQLGFKTPPSQMIEGGAEDGAKQVFTKIAPPWLVKAPFTTQASPVYVAKDINELFSALKLQLEDYGSAYVEEYIPGERATGGIIEHFRDQTWYRLVPKGNLAREKKDELEDMAEKLHLKLGFRHYSQF